MDTRAAIEVINDPLLPLSSLRLLVPPLRLLSAAMWQVAKQRDVLHYDKVQEFVSLVTATVPELLSHRQRAQLILGLRARLVLELCRGPAEPHIIQPYLDRLPTIPPGHIEYRDVEVEASASTFVALIQSLLKDPSERAYFFQVVFPVEYGPKYDTALQSLMWEFLTRLEQLFPVPDLKQTAAWISSTPSVLEECVQSAPEDLNLIYEHHKSLGHLKGPAAFSSSIGDCILSSLSIPPSQRAVVTTQPKTFAIRSESMHNYANMLNPISLMGVDADTVVMTVYTEVEVGTTGVSEEIVESANEVYAQANSYKLDEQVIEIRTDCNQDMVTVYEDDNVGEEISAVETISVEEEQMETVSANLEQAHEGGCILKEVETLTETIAVKKEVQDHEAVTVERCNSETVLLCVEMAAETVKNVSNEVCEKSEDLVEGSMVHKLNDLGGQNDGVEVSGTSQPYTKIKDVEQPQDGRDTSNVVTSSRVQQPTSSNVRRSTRLKMKTTRIRRQKGQADTSEEENNKTGKRSKDKNDHADASSKASLIAIRRTKTGGSVEVISIIFSCPQCPFHNGEEKSSHIHMQSVDTEEYNKLMASKLYRAAISLSPRSTDQIFASIKLLPPANTIKVEYLKNPHNTDRFTCDTCGRIFTRTSDVKRHQLTHTGERPFNCSHCDRTFQHSWDLAKHERKHFGTPVSFPCQQCESSFPNLRSLTVHHRKSHPGEGELPQLCSICGKSFPTASELLEHRKTHGASLRYICQQCGEGFDSLLARSQHRQNHLVKRQFKCAHCDKSYTRRADVKRHMVAHTGERPYQCNQCGRRFSLRFMLKKHLKVHTGERPFQCSHCPKRFTLVSILTRHERMHTGERPYLCSQCGKCFLSQGELSKHYRSHKDERPYPCNQCEKRFKSKKAQQEHIISHTGVRPYPCTICGKGFTKPYALTRHNLIHTGERPFPCSYCGKTFLTLGEAQLHERIHTGERPYPCPVCDQKFRSSSEMARHRRCHAGVRPARPYCQQCMKNFSSWTKLKKHMEIHSKTEEVQCSNVESVESVEQVK